MIKEIIIGKRYHLKFDVSDLMAVLDSNLSYSLTFRNPSGTQLVKYRLQVNGTWQTWVNLPTTGSTFQMAINQTTQQLSTVIMGTPTILCTTFAGSNITAFEICGFVSSNTFDESLEDVDKFFKQHMDDASVSIRLYTNTEEVNVVEKNPTFVAYMWGTFRQEIDVLNPSIIIESDEMPRFNYIWIEELYRFYFVRNIIILRDGIYRIDCHVDVLNTYWQDIEDQTEVFILRTENGGNSMLVDNRRPRNDNITITYEDVTGTGDSNVTFNSEPDVNEQRFILTSLSLVNAQGHNYVSPPSDFTGELPIVDCKIGTTEQSYVIDDQQMGKLLNGFFNKSSIESYVVSLIYLPFYVDFYNQVTKEDICIGTFKYDQNTNQFVPHDTPLTPINFMQGERLDNCALQYCVIADFTISPDYSDEQNFMNYSPVTTYEIYLPFIGWIQLDNEKILDNEIVVYYAIDVHDGSANVYIWDRDNDKILYSNACQVGVQIGISVTNQEELRAQKRALNQNLGLSLIGAGIGALFLPYLAAAGAALAGVKAIFDYNNKNAQMFNRAQTSFNGSDGAMYSDITHVYIRKTTHEPLAIDEDVYAHMNGYPVNQYGDMTTYVGTGYIECVVHWSSSNSLITQAEIDEIESLAKDGIII